MKTIKKSLLLYSVLVQILITVPSSAQYSKSNQVHNSWQEADQRHVEVLRELNRIEGRKGNSLSSIKSITGQSWEEAEQRHFETPEKIREKEFALTEEYSRENVIEQELNKYRKHEFNAAWQIADYEYEEPDVMHQGGTMYGLKGSYTYRPSFKDPLYNKIANLYRIDGQINTMDVDYEAFGEQSGLKHFGVNDSMYEVRGILGKEYYDKVVRVLLYTGLGYRYLLDDGGGELIFNPYTGYSYYSYDRESNYYYVPIGGELEFPSKNNWSMTLKGEYDILVYGQQFSHLTDGNQFQPAPEYYAEDITNNQHHGFGIKGALEICRKSNLIDFYLEPFFDYWNIEGSDPTYSYVNGDFAYMWEPPNKTTTYGARVGVKF